MSPDPLMCCMFTPCCFDLDTRGFDTYGCLFIDHLLLKLHKLHTVYCVQYME